MKRDPIVCFEGRFGQFPAGRAEHLYSRYDPLILSPIECQYMWVGWGLTDR